MDLLPRDTVGAKREKLITLLFRYRGFLSTKESEKIYSVLGLVDDDELEQLALNIEYALPWQDVYRELAIA